MKPKPVLPEVDLPAAFRARLVRLHAWLRDRLTGDLDLLLAIPATGDGTSALERMRAERTGRPHLSLYWLSGPPMTGLTLPLPVGIALQLVEDGIDALAATMADQAVYTVALFADKKLKHAVLARPLLVEQWPRPRREHSAAAFALHGLTALLSNLPPGEMLPDRMETAYDETQRAVWLYWPVDAALGEVARWARRTLNTLILGAGDSLVDTVARGLVPSDWTLPLDNREVLVLASGMAVVYLAENDVRTGLNRRSMAIDAGSTHHDMLGGIRDVPQDGKRHRAKPATLQAKVDENDQIERIELIAPGQKVQLTLRFTDYEAMHDTAVEALRRMRGPEGLRHWAALLRLFSVEGGRSGSYRWLLDEHLVAMGYHERERARPEVRAKAAEMVEFLAALELAIYTKGGELRERRRLLLETARFERLDGSQWKLDGIEFQMNQRVYGGVRASTGELGHQWMPAPVELAQIDHVRFPYAHALGMLLAIRFRWRLDERADYIAISGSKLLDLTGIKRESRREERAWTALRKTLDQLVKVGQIEHYTWTEDACAWSPLGVCRIYAAQWLLDRAVRGVIPDEKPPDRDKPVTGAELKTWREKRGWSQREAALKLGVGQAAISKAENKSDEPLGHKLRAAFQTATAPDLVIPKPGDLGPNAIPKPGDLGPGDS